LPGRVAIDERDRQAALGEMKRNRCADDAGAEHERIEARHDVPFPKLRRPCDAGGATVCRLIMGCARAAAAGLPGRVRAVVLLAARQRSLLSVLLLPPDPLLPRFGTLA